MLLGTHAVRLDNKWRLLLPARFRHELADGLVITQGQERCLYVFAVSDFPQVADHMHEMASSPEGSQQYARAFLESAKEQQPDVQGRVGIASSLREYAGLTRDCVVVGAETRVEIWNRATWVDLLGESESPFDWLGPLDWAGL